MNAHEIWHAALGELQLQMTKATYDTWVRPTRALAFDAVAGAGGALTVAVHSPYAKEWLENRLDTTIRRTVTGIVGQSTEVRYVIENKSSRRDMDDNAPATPRSNVDANDNQESLPTEAPHTGMDMALLAKARAELAERGATPLNPKYKFETFIVGNSNRFAHAAALAVAQNPGSSYNPLFLYGGTGLGKTHLLHAVGQTQVARNKRVCYVSSETFTNDLINAIRNQNTAEFRQVYREVDVLLIDDIQFIAGKESTQEEFFHTFNHLQSANKQIVISSDRHPRAITTLEDRMRSRFEGGMITDIQPPDLETRIAILRAKAEGQREPVPGEVIDFIAHKVQSNIRELEGALTRIIAYSRLMSLSISVEMATNVLQDILRHQPITVEQVLATVAEFYKVDMADLTGRSRNKEVVGPRQMAMYLLREETDASLPQIGDLLGGRDHTTVIYAYDKMTELIETDDQRRREALAIKERLYKQPS